MRKRIIVCALAAVLAVSGSACTSDKNQVKLNPNDPVLLTVWHYYNGKQQQTFDELVKEFNETVGAEKGICVEAHTKGSVNELSDAVYAAAAHQVGSEEMPDIFASYADTAYDIDRMDLLANLDTYMTEEEIASYMEPYIQEGYLNQDTGLKVFPIAKSTEIFLLNETAWQEFESETGADKSKLSTWEGLADIAEAYYEWTDAKTPDVEGDGQTFFGRDAFANYMLIGSKQLGHEMFNVTDGKATLSLDRDTMRKLWDCYYVPYVNSWYGAFGRFRSDDIKTGQIVALVGSTSGAMYFPSEVTDDAGNTDPIECGVYTLPNFLGTEPCAVQQGAGMVVTKSTPEKEYAATVFLKWITEPENNLRLGMESGYLPVTKEANDPAYLKNFEADSDYAPLLREVEETGLQITSTYELYTTKPFEGGNAVRRVVESHMQEAAAAAVQTRDERIAGGEDRAAVMEDLTGDSAFESWYSAFEAALSAAIEEQ